jgi:hypothetical protein
LRKATLVQRAIEVWKAVKAVLLDPKCLERSLDAYLEFETERDGGPREGGSGICEQDRRGRPEEGLEALEERRSKIRELHLSCEKILARYREVVPEALEEADGKQRRGVYNTLGVTVWVANAQEDPIKIVFGALGGEEVCQEDATSTR